MFPLICVYLLHALHSADDSDDDDDDDAARAPLYFLLMTEKFAASLRENVNLILK